MSRRALNVVERRINRETKREDYWSGYLEDMHKKLSGMF